MHPCIDHGIDHGAQPSITAGSGFNEATNVSLALAELQLEGDILKYFICRQLGCLGTDGPAFGRGGEVPNAGPYLAEGQEESGDA